MIDAGAARRAHLRSALRLPATSLAVGLALVGLAERGAGGTPALAAAILLAGVVAGLAPLRVGLPAAAFLACFEGTIEDFAGTPGRYWKEAFVLGLVVRSLLARKPRRGEAVAVLGIAAIGAAYLLTGSTALEVGWGFKILLMPVVAGWAIGRRTHSPRTWRSAFTALAAGIGANVVLAAWERIRGANHLLDLGFSYGDRVRIAPGGTLRAFGAATSPAAFSYLAALVLLAWLALLLAGGASRARAVQTIWVPVAAAIGIELSLDRIALVGVAVAALVVAGLDRSRRAIVPLAAVAVLVAGLLIVGPSAGFLSQGFTLGSDSAAARRALWPEYAKHLSVLGQGPAAAGAAYERAHRGPAGPPLVYWLGWQPLEHEGASTFRWMGTSATLVAGRRGRRAASILALSATSLAVPRRLAIVVGHGVRRTVEIPSPTSRRLRIDLPGGTGQLAVRLRASPPAQSATVVSPGDVRRLAIRVFAVEVSPLPQPSLAERILTRAKANRRGAALAGTNPGVVDDQYLTWVFQYGLLLGPLVCVLWLTALLWPVASQGRGPLLNTARMWGVFVAVAALAVNAWEEVPVGFLAALALGLCAATRARA